MDLRRRIQENAGELEDMADAEDAENVGNA